MAATPTANVGTTTSAGHSIHHVSGECSQPGINVQLQVFANTRNRPILLRMDKSVNCIPSATGSSNKARNQRCTTIASASHVGDKKTTSQTVSTPETYCDKKANAARHVDALHNQRARRQAMARKARELHPASAASSATKQPALHHPTSAMGIETSLDAHCAKTTTTEPKDRQRPANKRRSCIAVPAWAASTNGKTSNANGAINGTKARQLDQEQHSSSSAGWHHSTTRTAATNARTINESPGVNRARRHCKMAKRAPNTDGRCKRISSPIRPELSSKHPTMGTDGRVDAHRKKPAATTIQIHRRSTSGWSSSRSILIATDGTTGSQINMIYVRYRHT